DNVTSERQRQVIVTGIVRSCGLVGHSTANAVPNISPGLAMSAEATTIRIVRSSNARKPPSSHAQEISNSDGFRRREKNAKGLRGF
ncbi:hypothetical protein TNCV_2475751, partial [Trichonephila clavipes]